MALTHNPIAFVEGVNVLINFIRLSIVFVHVHSLITLHWILRLFLAYLVLLITVLTLALFMDLAGCVQTPVSCFYWFFKVIAAQR